MIQQRKTSETLTTPTTNLIMKSQDITAIATSIIAAVVLFGGLYYFQKEGEKKRLRQERYEQMQLNMKKEKARLLRERGERERERERYEKYRQDITDCGGAYFKEKYKACMTKKGYPENQH